MKKKQMLAVIDIGSLSTAMKIFSISPDKAPEVIESIRMFLPLGTYTYRDGYISEQESLSSLSRILNDFLETLRTFKVQKMICVATSAFREAKNRDFVIEQIRLRTGFSVEILDNSMERYYRNLVLKETLDGFSELIADGTLILDMGAGSIQTTLFSGGSLVFSQNMLLGPLRIADLYADLSRDTSRPRDILEEHISRVLEDYHAIAPKGMKYKTLILFGEETAYMKVLMGLDPKHCGNLSTEDFSSLFELLEKTSVPSLVMDKHIPSPAAGLLWPSVLLTKKTLEYGGIDKILLPEVSLTDGIAYDYAAQRVKYPLRFDMESDILTAIRHMGKRYRYDKKHAEQVGKFAICIFDNTFRFHGLSKRERLLLETAAILYEAGKHIHASDFYSRSYHIINSTEILGLTKRELEIVAHVTRLCGKETLFSDSRFQELGTDRKNVISKLASILRIADALEVSRKQKIVNITVHCGADTVSILCDHQADISYECWEFHKKKSMFYAVYGVLPELKTRRITK